MAGVLATLSENPLLSLPSNCGFAGLRFGSAEDAEFEKPAFAAPVTAAGEADGVDDEAFGAGV